MIGCERRAKFTYFVLKEMEKDGGKGGDRDRKWKLRISGAIK